MKTRNKLMAIFGASALALSVAGVALATDLNEGQVGTTLDNYYNEEECASWPADAPEIGPGQIGIHFILTSPASDSGNLSAEFSNPATSVGPIANYDSPAASLHFYVVITGDGDTVIDSATTDTEGNNLNVSHTCPGPEPTFSLDTGGETDAPSEPSTDSIGTSGTSGPADGAWLLVVALGVLLASIVVLTPARAKSRR